MASTYVSDKPCKNGHALRYVSTGRCAECNRARFAKHAAKYPERVSARKAEWARRNPEIKKARNADYLAKNPERFLAHANKRRAAQHAAEAPLSSEETERVLAIYAERARLQRLTGRKYRVDHVVPLTAGGRHHPDNLRVIPAAYNLAKHAKTGPAADRAVLRVMLS